MSDINAFEKQRTLTFPALIVAGCVLFNFGLCFVNTNIFTISPALIMACEGLLVASAVLYGCRRIDQLKAYWIVILALLCLLVVLLSLARHEALLKPFRDILIMPVFVILGLSAIRLNLTKFMLWFTFLIVIVAFVEAFFPNPFLDIFNFKRYFVDKGAMEDHAWLEKNTFASGTRPGGRFLFDLPGIHRISSVFLEPVSLGFYAFIAALYFIASKDHMKKVAYIFGLSLCFVLIWFSDARMALICSVLALLGRFVFRRVDHRFALLIIPFFLLISWFVDAMGLLSITGEGFGARVHWTMDHLSHTSFEIFLGAAGYNEASPDSALGDLMGNTGFLGVLLFWLTPALFMKRLPERARVYFFGISVFFAFGFVLSPAIFTIKTAALLWFIYGYLVASDLDLEFARRTDF